MQANGGLKLFRQQLLEILNGVCNSTRKSATDDLSVIETKTKVIECLDAWEQTLANPNTTSDHNLNNTSYSHRDKEESTKLPKNEHDLGTRPNIDHSLDNTHIGHSLDKEIIFEGQVCNI